MNEKLSLGDEKKENSWHDLCSSGCMDAPQHVLVGYDGSRLSELALHRAFLLTKTSRFALVHVVCVVQESEDHKQVRLPTGEVLTRYSALESLRLVVKGLTKELCARFPQARLVVHLRSGQTAQSLVDFAYRYHIDQIVLGARGLSDRDPLKVGQVAHEVLEITDIPVHLESPMTNMPDAPAASPLRWAYVFGGPLLAGVSASGDHQRASA